MARNPEPHELWRLIEEPYDETLKRKWRKTSKRYRGFPNQTAGKATTGRSLTGDELEQRKRELAARYPHKP